MFYYQYDLYRFEMLTIDKGNKICQEHYENKQAIVGG